MLDQQNIDMNSEILNRQNFNFYKSEEDINYENHEAFP